MSIHEGWVKLHRKVIDSRVFSNPGLFKVWMYCLCRANHETNFVPISTGKGETEVEVKPGQFITGRNSAAKDLSMNPNTVYKRIKKLEKMGNITIQSNNHYSVVSICKWGTYQNDEKQKEQGKEQAGNSEVSAKYQRSNTEKNDNNDKNEKKRGVTRESLKIILNNFGKPIFAKELFEDPEFSEAFLDYWQSRWKNYHHQPNEVSVKECYRRLVELKESGNNPVAVIRQSIRGDNKELFPLRDQEYSEQKIAEEHVPQYLTRRL